jgi:hypothetical protein
MKPTIVWSLRAQDAWDRLVGGPPVSPWPNTPRTIRDLRERLPDIFEGVIARKPLDFSREHTMKCTVQRTGYQRRGDPPPPEEPREKLLELCYRFADEGRVVEIISVASPKYPI